MTLKIERVDREAAEGLDPWLIGPACSDVAASRFASHRVQACGELVLALERLLPFIEGPRLIEEGRAAAMEINRMPIRQAVRNANAVIAKHKETEV